MSSFDSPGYDDRAKAVCSPQGQPTIFLDVLGQVLHEQYGLDVTVRTSSAGIAVLHVADRDDPSQIACEMEQDGWFYRWAASGQPVGSASELNQAAREVASVLGAPSVRVASRTERHDPDAAQHLENLRAALQQADPAMYARLHRPQGARPRLGVTSGHAQEPVRQIYHRAASDAAAPGTYVWATGEVIGPAADPMLAATALMHALGHETLEKSQSKRVVDEP
jgi:hypothetical protein